MHISILYIFSFIIICLNRDLHSIFPQICPEPLMHARQCSGCWGCGREKARTVNGRDCSWSLCSVMEISSKLMNISVCDGVLGHAEWQGREHRGQLGGLSRVWHWVGCCAEFQIVGTARVWTASASLATLHPCSPCKPALLHGRRQGGHRQEWVWDPVWCSVPALSCGGGGLSASRPWALGQCLLRWWAAGSVWMPSPLLFLAPGDLFSLREKLASSTASVLPGSWPFAKRRNMGKCHCSEQSC